jgi:hypothetical protein
MSYPPTTDKSDPKNIPNEPNNSIAPKNPSDNITDKSWTVTNTNTLLKWISIGSHYIKVLEKNIADNRMVIRLNTIQSIALTTATGSIGVSQISSIFSAQTQLVLTMIFTIMSFLLTLYTGVIKVLLIKENLEKYIQVKQEWTSFITNISTELQLPRGERQDAIKLIRDNKMMYLSLLNKDIELNYMSEIIARKRIEEEINISKKELDQEKCVNSFKKNGKNDFLIDLDFTKKTALHNDYSKMMNSVGISISDITNHIVKTELQAIVEFDLEAQYRQVKKKETQIAKEKFTMELQNKVKDMDTKRSSNMLMITQSPSNPTPLRALTHDISNTGENRMVAENRMIVENKEHSETIETDSAENDKESTGFFRNLFRV